MSPPPDSVTVRRRQQIEAYLRANLADAVTGFKKAHERCQKAALEAQLVPWNSGWRLAFSIARGEQWQATQRYGVALHEFTDFAVRGIIPDRLRDVA